MAISYIWVVVSIFCIYPWGDDYPWGLRPESTFVEDIPGSKRGKQQKHSFITGVAFFERCNTSSTAQGGGGSFKNRKPIGEIGCCNI